LPAPATVLHNGAVLSIKRSTACHSAALAQSSRDAELLFKGNQRCTQWYKAFTETYGCRATLLHCVIFALEANLFRIPELQAALYEKNFRFMSVFSGGKNLFDIAPWLAY
jgi:hypothetical protein